MSARTQTDASLKAAFEKGTSLLYGLDDGPKDKGRGLLVANKRLVYIISQTSVSITTKEYYTSSVHGYQSRIYDLL